MKPQVLTILGLRVVAVFLAAQSFVFLAQAAIYFVLRPAGMPSVPPAFFVAFWLLGPFVAALIIWWGAPYLAHLATRGVSDAQVMHVNPQVLVGTTLVAAGALIFVTALPSLATDVLRFYVPPNQLLLPELLGKVLQCILGIGLVIGSGTASKLLLRLRYAGTEVPDL
jgi:hypothetical protein